MLFKKECCYEIVNLTYSDLNFDQDGTYISCPLCDGTVNVDDVEAIREAMFNANRVHYSSAELELLSDEELVKLLVLHKHHENDLKDYSREDLLETIHSMTEFVQLGLEFSVTYTNDETHEFFERNHCYIAQRQHGNKFKIINAIGREVITVVDLTFFDKNFVESSNAICV